MISTYDSYFPTYFTFCVKYCKFGPAFQRNGAATFLPGWCAQFEVERPNNQEKGEIGNDVSCGPSGTNAGFASSVFCGGLFHGNANHRCRCDAPALQQMSHRGHGRGTRRKDAGPGASDETRSLSRQSLHA